MESIFTSAELLEYLREKFGQTKISTTNESNKENQVNFNQEKDLANLLDSFSLCDNLTHQLSTYFHATQKPIQPDLTMLVIWVEFLQICEFMAFRSSENLKTMSAQEYFSTPTKDLTNMIEDDPLILNELKDILRYYSAIYLDYYKYELFWTKSLAFFKKFFPKKLEKYKNESLSLVELRDFPNKSNILELIKNDGLVQDEKNVQFVTDSPFKKKPKFNEMNIKENKYPDTPLSIPIEAPRRFSPRRNIPSNTQSETFSPPSDMSSNGSNISQKKTADDLLFSIPFERTESITATLNRELAKQTEKDSGFKRNMEKNREFTISPVKNQQDTNIFTVMSQSFNSREKSSIFVNDREYFLQNTIGKGGSSVVHLISSFNDPTMTWACKSILNIFELKILKSYINEIILMCKMRGIKEIVQIYGFEIKEGNFTIFGYTFADHKRDLLSDETPINDWSIKKDLQNIITGLNNLKLKHDTFYNIHIIMERGHSDLARFLKNQKVDRLLLFQKLLRIMVQLYDLRIIHADIKPANFIIMNPESPEFSIKLIDFGISRETPSNTTSIIQKDRIGTINYICPEKMMTDQERSEFASFGKKMQLSQDEGFSEQKHGNSSSDEQAGDNSGAIRYNRSSDVWSFGMIVYEIIFGKSLFDTLELKGNSEKIRWLRGGKLEFCRCVREVFDLIPANNIT
ncbi:Dual specificity, serine/threonine and tyrosine kinase, partial [Pseudoloma neurophilia]